MQQKKTVFIEQIAAKLDLEKLQGFPAQEEGRQTEGKGNSDQKAVCQQAKSDKGTGEVQGTVILLVRKKNNNM